MKTIFAVTLLAVTTVASAQYDPFRNVRDDMCLGIKKNLKTETAVCQGAKNIQEVMSAKVGKNLTAAESDFRALGFYVYGPVDIGVVDDSGTSGIFSHQRWLLNAAGKRVGVLSIDGWHNYSMEARGRVDTRYNLKGEIVSIAIKDF